MCSNKTLNIRVPIYVLPPGSVKKAQQTRVLKWIWWSKPYYVSKMPTNDEANWSCFQPSCLKLCYTKAVQAFWQQNKQEKVNLCEAMVS
jgi:hypothetical protein